MGFAVNFPPPCASLRAEPLQQDQQCSQSICEQIDDYDLKLQRSQTGPPPRHTQQPKRPTARDEVGVDDELVRNDAAAGDEQLVVTVVHDVVESVDPHKHHVGMSFQIHQVWNLNSRRCEKSIDRRE